MVGVLLAISVGSFDAEAKGPGPRSVHKTTKIVFQWRNFFDADYAKSVMHSAKSFKDLDNGFDAAFLKWEEQSKGRTVKQSLAALEKHPRATEIKQAHDNQHLWEWWVYNLSGITRPSQATTVPWNGWNKWGKQQCGWIKKRARGLWEGCIVPDWRSPEMVAEDEAYLAKKAALKKN
ncbi:MAG: hypothetical protein ABJN40_23000 [Sneathiella sp.]